MGATGVINENNNMLQVVIREGFHAPPCIIHPWEPYIKYIG